MVCLMIALLYVVLGKIAHDNNDCYSHNRITMTINVAQIGLAPLG